MSPFKKYFKIFLLTGITTFGLIQPLLAADYSKSVLPFDKATSYDVYFYSGEENKCVIKDVEIAGFREIGGKSFLVIKAYGFKLKDVEGFILFDSVAAILPNHEFRVNSVQQINIQ